MTTLNNIKKICQTAVSNPNDINSLLISQLATNPRGFKFSETAIEKIESKKDFKSKLFCAVQFGLDEKIIVNFGEG